MEEEEKTVEEKDQNAVTEPTELEIKLAAKDAELKKLADERDNYKRGMLKAKGKSSDDDSKESEETLDEKIARISREQLLDTQFMKAQVEKDEIIKQALARNKELETTIKNRSQISTTEGGSGNEVKMVPKDPTISEEKIKALRAKGWDDKKIELFKKNLRKTS